MDRIEGIRKRKRKTPGTPLAVAKSGWHSAGAEVDPREKARQRCVWAVSERAVAYHDVQWGQPITDPQKLFMVLSLCSQQAGLSWRIVWSKREAYTAAFRGFELDRVATITDAELDKMAANAKEIGVMGNRRKLQAIRDNAAIYLAIDLADRKKGEPLGAGFARWLWSYVDGHPVVNTAVWTHISKTPTVSEVSAAMAKDFKARGISWLGSITIYAFLQQCGLQNDHCATCFRNPLSDCHEPPPATSIFGAASPIKQAARMPVKRAAPSAKPSAASVAGPGKTRQTAKAGKADKAGKGGNQKAPVAAARKKRPAGTSRTAAKTAPGSAGKTPSTRARQGRRAQP